MKDLQVDLMPILEINLQGEGLQKTKPAKLLKQTRQTLSQKRPMLHSSPRPKAG